MTTPSGFTNAAEFTSALILNGGQSRRMGRPKADITVHGKTMLECVLAAVATVSGDVVIVGGPAPNVLGEFRHIADEHPGAGPLAAFAHGMKHVNHEVVVCVGCDMPNLDPGVLRTLIDFLEPDADAVVPCDTDGRLQVLHAVYRARCAQVASTLLQSGQKSMTRLCEALNVVVAENLDGGPASWFNVNSPQDLEEI